MSTWTMAKMMLGAGVVASIAASGCGPRDPEIQRVESDAVIDVNTRFNETDARLVQQGMVNDALFRTWIDNWMRENNGQRPVIIIGSVKNNTQDYINTKLFTRSFERELLNSGRVRIVSARDDRGELRDERLQGQEWNSPETRKFMKNELGADLMLLGDINQVRQESPTGRRVVNYYQVNLDLTNLETNEKVWIGTVDVKKTATE